MLKQEHSITPNEILSPPYVSFSTFKTLMDWLRAEGVPLRLDRSFWRSKFSGSTGTQLIAALRFLGLVQGESPTQDLHTLVDSIPEDRKFILGEILKHSYVNIAFKDLDRATPSMLKGWFRIYPIDGHTLRKAMSFFVNASKDAEIPMSNSIQKMARTRISRTNRPSTRIRQATVGQIVHSTQDSDFKSIPKQDITQLNSMRGNLMSLNLESGGTVTVELSLDLFKLSAKDREFIMKLVDLTQNYES